MSQYPPNQPYPPHQPQHPGYPPQGGYPQQGGYPPQGGGYPPPGGPMGYGGPQGHQPAGTNGWGIASLVTGLVGFCVPFLGGLLALLFGFIGIAKARKVRSGMGLSVVGLILGLLSLGVYVLFGGAIWALIQGTQVNRDVAKQFINDVHAGNIQTAQGATDGSITAGELQSVSQALQRNGTIKKITTFSFKVDTAPGQGQAVIGGQIDFNSGQAGFSMVQTKSGDQWKVSQFVLNPNAPGSITIGGGGPGSGGTGGGGSGDTNSSDTGNTNSSDTTDKDSTTDDAAGEK